MAHYPLYTQNLSLVGVCVKRIGKVRSFARGNGRPRRWRCMARSARGRHGPARRTACSSRRLCARHTAAAPPPGAFRGMARTWFPPRREGACRSECRGRPRSALSGAACSWPGRCAVSLRCPPLRTSTRQPCRPGSAPGQTPGAPRDKARRTRPVATGSLPHRVQTPSA